MAAEKAVQKQKNKRRKRIRGKVILTVFLLTAVFLVLSTTVLFRVDEKQVQGSVHYSAEEILEAAQIPVGTNLFRVDRKGAEQRICSRLPYIQTAKVSIVLPDALQITVEEGKPYLQIKEGNTYYLLDRDLKIMDVSKQRITKSVPVVTGSGMNEAQAGDAAIFPREGVRELLLELTQSVETCGLKGITAINAKKLYAVELQYRENLLIRLGSAGDLSRKMRMVKKLVEERLDPSQAGTLDLSVQEGQAIFRPDYGASQIILPPEEEIEPAE